MCIPVLFGILHPSILCHCLLFPLGTAQGYGLLFSHFVQSVKAIQRLCGIYFCFSPWIKLLFSVSIVVTTKTSPFTLASSPHDSVLFLSHIFFFSYFFEPFLSKPLFLFWNLSEQLWQPPFSGSNTPVSTPGSLSCSCSDHKQSCHLWSQL